MDEVDPPAPVLEHPPVPTSIQDSDKAIEDLTETRNVSYRCRFELTAVRRLFEPRQARGYSFVAPTEPERIQPVRRSPAPLPPPSSPSTLTKRLPPVAIAEESDDEIEFVGETPPDRVPRKRQRLSSQPKKIVPRSGTRASPCTVPDTPLRELSPTLSLLSPSHRPRTVHRSGTRALPEDVRYRLGRELFYPAG